MKILKEQVDKLENDAFDNEQMLFHFGDISDEIDAKISEGKIIVDEEVSVQYKSHEITVDAVVIKFAYIYNKLEKTYRLEAKTLMEEVFKRGEIINFSELDLINLLKAVRKQHKLQMKKAIFKKKIIWLKGDDLNLTH